ncbi:MAG TPA: DUF1829 domain-containing protein [Bacillus bacterium]|nr:DUF1829 domain-containing protein [Bacillus sp. (in: firmicutes)]
MIDQLKMLYNEWNQKKIEFEDFSSFIEITTPFVDMHHDYIQLFLTKENNTFIISDDGHILNELEMLGIDVKKTQKRKEFLYICLKTFGVKIDHATNELFVSFENLIEYPEWQHRLIQCLLRISDMLLTSRNTVISIFTEEIENFFLDKGVLFNEGPSYTGLSGKTQHFDFSLPRSKTRNEKLIRAINVPSADSYVSPLFAWMDIKDVRKNSEFIVIANDTKKRLTKSFLEPFHNYSVDVFKWSEKEEWVENLKTVSNS